MPLERVRVPAWAAFLGVGAALAALYVLTPSDAVKAIVVVGRGRGRAIPSACVAIGRPSGCRV